MMQIIHSYVLALLPPALAAVGGVLIYIVVLMWRRQYNRQLRQSPLSHNLLRSPGRSLSAKLEDIEVEISASTTLLLLAPPLVYAVHLSHSYYLGQSESFLRFLFSFAVLVGCTVFSGKKLFEALNKKRDFVIGLEGELATGEELNQLMLEGCRVFHDIQFPYGNIDHVVVSNSGVHSVETKMLGKPKEGKGKANVVVDHRSDVIRMPDRDYRIPVQQLETQAKWLSQELTKAVQKPIDVEPMLAIPGWFVTERIGRSSVYVFSPASPQRFFVRNRQVLTDEMVQQVAHQLEQRCRNVEPSFREKSDWSSGK